MLSKRQFIINADPKQLFTFTILYFLSPNRNISFLISCDQKMAHISVCFCCIFIQPLKNFIGLNFKLFNNQINIFETNIRCSVISKTCYVNLFNNKNEVSHETVSGPSIKPWGTPKSISCHVLYLLSIFTRCFLPTR